MKRILVSLIPALFVLATPAWAEKDAPSRTPVEGCQWEKLTSAQVGLDAWVQRCDFGFRKIDLFWKGNAIMIRYSDGGEPFALVEVIDLDAGEPIETGIRRIFAEHTGDKSLVKRCVLAPYTAQKPPAGIKRYTFVPDKALQKELDAKADPDEVPDPPCGDWGDAPDGIQYFEAQPASGVRKVLFVRVGQDEPLFDEKTLRLLPPAKTPLSPEPGTPLPSGKGQG
jgi:hypothetical protein